jgi:hypothetical protein
VIFRVGTARVHGTSEREGFEPSRGLSPLLAFQASAFNRSTTSPDRRSARSSTLPIFAAVLAVLLVGQTPTVSQRRAVAGHYKVPAPAAGRGAADPGNTIANARFQSGDVNGGWYQCGDVTAYVTREHPFDGAFDEYSGTRSGLGEPLGNSGVCQLVTIPHAGILSARLYQLSDENDTAFAYQEADLLDDRGNVVVNLFRAVNDEPRWVLGRWNLGAYSGRTFWLYFGVHGDGDAKRSTEQFLDDVTLTGTSSPAPQ